jgi:hypothetical protein
VGLRGEGRETRDGRRETGDERRETGDGRGPRTRLGKPMSLSSRARERRAAPLEWKRHRGSESVHVHGPVYVPVFYGTVSAVVPSGRVGGKARDLPYSEWCNDSRENLEALSLTRQVSNELILGALRPRGFPEKRNISGACGVPRIPTRPPARDDKATRITRFRLLLQSSIPNREPRTASAHWLRNCDWVSQVVSGK